MPEPKHDAPLKDEAACGTKPAPPCTLVIFGAAGDLTKRLLMPSLYNLAGAGLLDAASRSSASTTTTAATRACAPNSPRRWRP